MSLTRLILTILLSGMIGKLSTGQILLNTSVDLNPGGVIHDVVYDLTQDGYFVVGDFNSINGTPVNNIAFINKSDFSVSTASNVNPVLSIDGEIRTIALKKVLSFLGDVITYIHLGGNFGTVEASNGTFLRKGIVQLKSTLPSGGDASSASDFTITNWDPDLDMVTGAEMGVNDIEIYATTVYVLGEFPLVNVSGSSEFRDGFATYDLVSGSLQAYPAMSATGTGFRRWMDMERIDGDIYVTGDNDLFSTYHGKVYKLDAAGNIDPSFGVYTSGLRCGYRIQEVDDSLLAILVDRNADDNAGDRIEIVRKSDGSAKMDHDFSHDGTGVIGGVGNQKHGVSVYKNYLFASTADPGNSVISYEHTGGGPVASPNWNASATNYLNDTWFGVNKIVDNILFVSASNLTSLSGYSRSRLGIYCLEPNDPQNFIWMDSTVCPEQFVTYSISSVSNAEGYIWEYTGNGADLDSTGAPENLKVVKSGTSANILDVQYTDLFSPGQLKVTAFTTCNGNLVSSDTLFSNPLILNIHSNPLPNAVAGNDTALTCIVDSILLSGYSDTTGCSYEWLNPGPWGNTIDSDTLIQTDGAFIFKATSPLGCPNYDTVEVFMDTIKPDVILPTSPYELNCSDSVITLLGSTSVTDSLSYWRDVGTNDTFPNPIPVENPGNYRYIVQNTDNGCVDSLELIVTLNQPNPNITVIGYPELNPAEPLDTLTCVSDTLFLTCGSDSSNTIANWTTADTSSLSGDYIEIDTSGNYYILVTDTATGCENFTAVNIAEFKTPPDAIVPEGSELNCSVDSLLLDGSSSLTDVDLIWTAGSIAPSSNPLTVYDADNYYLIVTRNDNGCTATDSVFVDETLDIEVLMDEDTLVCNGTSVELTGDYNGSISGISYLWDNGSTTSSATYTAAADEKAILEIFGDGGCYGMDTIWIDVPPTPVVEVETFQPCGDPNSGQIVITPISGLSPFQYSLDGGTTTQTSNVLTGLNIGPYTVTILDSIGCNYNFDTEISQESDIPEPNFLVSTYNFQSDTVALVNISNPPADSVEWIVPSELELIESNNEYAFVILPDTGFFDVSMNAWFGDCSATKTKTINSALLDTNSANHYNENGIESISLYPNPTSGNFTVEVEFYKSQRSSIAITDVSGYIYLQKDYDESLSITENFELDESIVNGTYVLNVISAFDSAKLVFVLNR